MAFDFVTIDFETANNNNNSACSIGLVAVKDMDIIETKYFLIHPPTLDFDKVNIGIHGIKPDDVNNSPLFPIIWDQIKHYFKNNVIVAHNASFDMSVLKCCLMEYGIEEPDFTYLCSIPISTRACRNKNVGRSLKDRAQYFNVLIENHHNSLYDALTCAKIVIASIQAQNRKSFKSFCSTYSSLPFKKFADLTPQKELKKNSSYPIKKYNNIVISEIATTNDCFNESHIFYGKNIVFTGELKSLERIEAMQKVVNLGAVVKSTVSSKTDFLIAGIQDKSIVGEAGMSSKEEKAFQLKNQGHNIQILTEGEFLKLL